ncbi:MAG: hypothetical protein HYT75_01860 [Deltaproteobacteria bacterium]|nr:hypothetical protein [Deltaproteobacteria bacterium]MBI2342236.1 hypothetical protein [Deltaproteobacteria bacterium]
MADINILNKEDGPLNTVYSFVRENPEVIAAVAAAKLVAGLYIARRWGEIKKANEVLRRLCGDDLTNSQLRTLRRGLEKTLKDYLLTYGVCNESCYKSSEAEIRNACAAVKNGRPISDQAAAGDAIAESAQFSAERVFKQHRNIETPELGIAAVLISLLALWVSGGAAAATASSFSPAIRTDLSNDRIIDKAGAL